MRFRRQIRPFLLSALLVSSVSFGEDTKTDAAAIRKLLSDASAIGLPVGSAAPQFELKDQSGRNQNFGSLTGPKGLVLVFFRSADW